ncbi:MAG TPA: fatty acyl-AMP ligase [Pseudonocardia sp.]|nr:fatty acyl-AMP ligase [Pseudonocardia sp.]
MSRFLTTLLATGAGSPHGMTTGEPRTPVRRSWPEIHQTARRAAGVLTEAGIGRGSAVGVLAGEPATIAPAAQAVWLVGGSVTMLHQPTARTDLALWAKETVGVLTMIGAKLVLLGAPFEALASVLSQHGIPCRLLTDLDGAPVTPDPDVAGEDDTALLQLTSGSTAEPKAVRITHRNLHSNIGAMVQAARLDTDTDVMVSWLPLFHDMGMVGFLTIPMAVGIELVSVTPTDFLGRPILWAELISRHHGTVTAAPNFAYAVLARQLARADEGSLDLSTLRFALNGAEPIDPAAVNAFTTAGARFGLRPEAVVCAYGMAETALGVSFAPIDTGLQVDEIDAVELEEHRRAVPVGDGPARRFPLLGPPLPGIELRVVCDDGAVLGEREVGVLQLRGESVTPGYLTVAGPVATQDADGWLDTGDEGYVTDGAVVVCGRRKDVIIMGGRNIYPTDIERAASEADGVRAGNAVAVRLEADAGRHRESFLVAVESRLATEPEAVQGIAKDVTSRVVSAVGVRPAEVVVLRPGSLPKTPSGKLRRAATRALLAARS